VTTNAISGINALVTFLTSPPNNVIAIGEDDNDTTTLKMPVFEDGPLEAALYWREHCFECKFDAKKAQNV
jgi:hypothetical protein